MVKDHGIFKVRAEMSWTDRVRVRGHGLDRVRSLGLYVVRGRGMYRSRGRGMYRSRGHGLYRVRGHGLYMVSLYRLKVMHYTGCLNVQGDV